MWHQQRMLPVQLLWLSRGFANTWLVLKCQVKCKKDAGCANSNAKLIIDAMIYGIKIQKGWWLYQSQRMFYFNFNSNFIANYHICRPCVYWWFCWIILLFYFVYVNLVFIDENIPFVSLSHSLNDETFTVINLFLKPCFAVLSIQFKNLL